MASELEIELAVPVDAPVTARGRVRPGLLPEGQVTIRLERRAYSPVLRKAALPAATTIPWPGNRTLRYEIT